jgi:homogentisate 1,2-dioxygenase
LCQVVRLPPKISSFNHSNISDEVLYYVDGDFMSRNNIEQDTLHPKEFRTVQHQEQWNEVLVITGTEVAVMVDTFRPLMVTEAMGLDDGQYYKSWVE